MVGGMVSFLLVDVWNENEHEEDTHDGWIRSLARDGSESVACTELGSASKQLVSVTIRLSGYHESRNEQKKLYCNRY